MTDETANPFGQAYAEYQSNRGALRKFIRTIYLKHAASLCRGRTLDFGCGVGELLGRLPAGSMGFEINPYALQYCRDRGLTVEAYDPLTDRYRLLDVAPGQFETLVISHVLEHLDDPDQVLRTFFSSCKRVGIRRLVMIVPGALGFTTDSTHRTFIARAYLQEKGIFDIPGVRVAASRYFPINVRALENYFRHHEMSVIFVL